MHCHAALDNRNWFLHPDSLTEFWHRDLVIDKFQKDEFLDSTR